MLFPINIAEGMLLSQSNIPFLIFTEYKLRKNMLRHILCAQVGCKAATSSPRAVHKKACVKTQAPLSLSIIILHHWINKCRSQKDYLKIWTSHKIVGNNRSSDSDTDPVENFSSVHPSNSFIYQFLR